MQLQKKHGIQHKIQKTKEKRYNIIVVYGKSTDNEKLKLSPSNSNEDGKESRRCVDFQVSMEPSI